MKVLVTGAGGFAGRALVPHLLDKGYRVTALVRRPESIAYSHPNLLWILGDTRTAAKIEGAAQGVDYIVHLAAAKSDEADSFAINVGGAENVIKAARAAQVRGIVNISTISTKFSQKGPYAETKSVADELFCKSTVPCITLRPSVIYGGGEDGIVGALIRYTRLPFTPVIGSGTATYRPILAKDVADAIEKILAKGIAVSAMYDLGGPDVVSFNALARRIGKDIYGKNVRLAHLPIPVALALARVFKLFLRKPPITVSNVIGANQNVSVETEAFTAEYSFHPRGLTEGLALVKKELASEVAEPFALMRYALFGMRPSHEEMRLYEQAVRFYNLEHAPLPFAVTKSPCRLKALDALTRFTNPNGVFRRKLLIAATLAECSPRTADRLLPRKVSLLSFLLQMCGVGLETAVALLYGLCLYPFVYDYVSI